MSTQEQIEAGEVRTVRVADLAAILSLLPPKPVEKDGTLFFFQDPQAATRLHQIREAFETMLATPARPRSAPEGESVALAARLRSVSYCERECNGRCNVCPDDLLREAAGCLEAQSAALQEMREAMEPFAKFADELDAKFPDTAPLGLSPKRRIGSRPNFGDCRRARKALQAGGG
jgi:hypothetical protein